MISIPPIKTILITKFSNWSKDTIDPFLSRMKNMNILDKRPIDDGITIKTQICSLIMKEPKENTMS